MRVVSMISLVVVLGTGCDTREPASGTASAADSAVGAITVATEDAASNTAEAGDSAEVVATVDAFHRALEQGDTAAVQRLLADDAIVLESGGVEDRTEYFEHHLGADMAFAAAVPGEREVIRVEVRDGIAWLGSTSRRQGTFRGREIDSEGAELVVLHRSGDGWRIASVHWSSR